MQGSSFFWNELKMKSNELWYEIQWRPTCLDMESTVHYRWQNLSLPSQIWNSLTIHQQLTIAVCDFPPLIFFWKKLQKNLFFWNLFCTFVMSKENNITNNKNNKTMKNLIYAILCIVFAIATLDMGYETIKAIVDLRLGGALFGSLLTIGAWMLTKACYKAM